MKNWIQTLIISVGFCLAAFTFAIPQAQAIDTSVRPNHFINYRGGFLFDTADSNIEKKWEHDTFNSFLMSVGIYRTFPEKWREFYFYAGPEFSYMDNEEYISAAGRTSTVSTTYMQTWLTGGVTWRPAVLQTDWYFSGFLGLSPWGQQSTDVGGIGYNRSFKDKTPSFFNGIGNGLYGGLSVCYDFFWEWSGCVTYENRTANIVTVGINYGL